MTNEVTIRKIDALEPIPGADKIELATIEGWKVVVQKGVYTVGQLAVYIAIDTWLPVNPAWAFLDKAPREYIGYGLGYRVKTIKLRGQISQGVLLPISEIDALIMSKDNPSLVAEGTDVTDVLGAKHWEKPIPVSNIERIKGNFPTWLRKTDQERAQNLKREIFGDRAKPADDFWEVSQKLDGSSITIYVKDGEAGVCSRNQDLKLEDTSNVFIKTAIETGIIAILKKLGRNIAVQGELMGPGVQDNHEGLGRNDIFIFDMFDIDAQRYYSPLERQHACLMLGLRHVPAVNIKPLGYPDMQTLIDFAVGSSMIAEQREGVVFKHQDGEFSFKVINNEFLLTKGE